MRSEPSSTRSTLSLRGGDRFWWTRSGTSPVKPFKKESEERNGKLCIIIKESCTRRPEPRSRSRVKKRRKPFWALTAARDRDEEFYDPARKEDVPGRTKNRLELWEEHRKHPVQRAFIDTKHIELERWGPPHVDADWHACCQAIF